MIFYIYMLQCSDGSYYVGHSDDLEKRIAAHRLGEIPGYTVTRRPIRLEFVEEFPTRLEALERERQIKGWSRRKKKALIRGDWDSIRRLLSAHGSTGSPRTDGGRRSAVSKAQIMRIQEDSDDYAVCIEQAEEPTIPFNEVVARLKAEGKL